MTEVLHIERLELAFAPRPWRFAEERHAEIGRNFDAVRRDKPAVWNGRILLLSEHAIAGEVFRGTYFETDYASFLAWRAWDFPDGTVKNCFSLGALRASDGGFLLGVMSSHTLNAGKIYFPAGTPEPKDIVGGMVDLAGSVRREVNEETGLDAGAYEAETGWYCICDRGYVAQIKILHARETAAGLRQRIRAHIECQKNPELADMLIVRGPADLDPMMPPFVTAFLRHVWNPQRHS